LKKKTETEPKLGQTDRFWFFREKTGLARFSSFGLVFSNFGSVFSILARFFPILARFFFGFGSVRFFWFFAYKTETEPNRPVFSKF
jgi:hypothetical protein